MCWCCTANFVRHTRLLVVASHTTLYAFVHAHTDSTAASSTHRSATLLTDTPFPQTSRIFLSSTAPLLPRPPCRRHPSHRPCHPHPRFSPMMAPWARPSTTSPGSSSSFCAPTDLVRHYTHSPPQHRPPRTLPSVGARGLPSPNTLSAPQPRPQHPSTRWRQHDAALCRGLCTHARRHARPVQLATRAPGRASTSPTTAPTTATKALRRRARPGVRRCSANRGTCESGGG